jgi:hypothetical protein
MPKKEADFVKLVGRWDEVLNDTAKVTAYGWDPILVAAVLSKINAFMDAYTAYEADKTALKRDTKVKKMKAVQAEMRTFARTSIRNNTKMTDEEKLDLGVHPETPGYHPPKPKPTDYVTFTLVGDSRSHSARADYYITGSDSKSKAPYHGVEVLYWVQALDDPAPIASDHPGSSSMIDTATPWVKAFLTHDIGKRLYVMMRWENQSAGKKDADPEASKGPWSGIQNMVIA